MMRPLLCSVLGMLVAFPLAAKAPEFVKSAPVADRPTVVRDSSLGYVLLRADQPTPLHLMRIPTAEDQAVYDDLRAKALEKERKKYPGKMKSYESLLASYNVIKKNNRLAKEPVKPIEPTESNFVFTPFNLMAAASIGPMNRFAKGENGKSVYLQSLTPGAYRIYGFMSVLPGGVFGACLCMGSVKFTVKAGEITDLGNVTSSQLLVPATSSADVDPRLNDWPIHSADYRAVGKLPNYFGLGIGRIQPIPGVIGYDRDQVIDLAARAADPALGQPSGRN